jgi:Family of unknown function (DUF5677)
MGADTGFVGFGIPESWKFFKEHYPVFIERFRNLTNLMSKTFERTASCPEPIDKVTYFLGRLSSEDFLEILLLVGNGYGIAGLKILRGMYERVVTARYLTVNPGEVDRFLDFHWVQQRKTIREIIRTFGEASIPSERVKEVDENYARVRNSFVVTACSACGRKDVSYTWSKLDFVSMARAAGGTGQLVALAYYLPMREAHSTTGAILSRLSLDPGNVLMFESGAQNREGEFALITAHNLLLNVIDLQKEYFKLEFLAEPLQASLDDFNEIWKSKSQSANNS